MVVVRGADTAGSERGAIAGAAIAARGAVAAEIRGRVNVYPESDSDGRVSSRGRVSAGGGVSRRSRVGGVGTAASDSDPGRVPVGRGRISSTARSSTARRYAVAYLSPTARWAAEA